MKRFFFLLITLVLGLSEETQAQELYGKPDLWNQLTIKHSFEKPWNVGMEAHYRLNNWVKQEQFLVRPFITYRANPSTNYSFGYSYIRTYPYDEYPLPHTLPEHNIWEEVMLKHSSPKINFQHRYRLEQRFIATGVEDSSFTFSEHTFTQRFRYRLTLDIPLTDKVNAILFDEIFLSTGEGFKQVMFDRNWIHLGASYKINPKVSLQLAYLYQYIFRTSQLYERHHGIQLAVTLKL